jgi:Ca2+-binding EF-hand superfamily protein
LRARFKSLDRKDGKVDQKIGKEQFLECLGAVFNEEQPAAALGHFLFSAFDKDHDGVIDFSEFLCSSSILIKVINTLQYSKW